jgi:hypothetical protein
METKLSSWKIKDPTMIETKPNCQTCLFICTYTIKDIKYNCYLHPGANPGSCCVVWYKLVEGDNKQSYEYLSNWIQDKNPDSPAYVGFHLAKLKGLLSDDYLKVYPF